MKIKISLDDKLPPTKTIELSRMKIITRAIFYKNNKY